MIPFTLNKNVELNDELIIQPKWHISIVIPAHNEEALLPRCLHSVLAACEQLSSPHTVDIILAIDSSTDKSFEIGKSIIQQKGEVINLAYENVGYVRKSAANRALERYSGPLENCWLANTDADCEVPLDWLSYQLAQANFGIQGIAGIVQVDSFSEHEDAAVETFLEKYIIHADGTHPHVHGANLGVRADAYVRVGGWRGLVTAEDHDLWNRLALLQIPKISDANLSVVTSGRRIGRAPDGFANRLNSFNRGTSLSNF